MRERSAGHEERFERIFPRLLAIARRAAHGILRDPDEAEDAAAEALARAGAHWPAIGERPYVEAWVARVAINVSLDISRAAGRRRAWFCQDQADAQPEGVGLDLDAALRSLPRRQREVVALRYLMDMSEADAAAALGIKVSTLKRHGERARDALRRNPVLEGALKDAV